MSQTMFSYMAPFESVMNRVEARKKSVEGFTKNAPVAPKAGVEKNEPVGVTSTFVNQFMDISQLK